MDNAILMASGADVDFMIHGLFSYELFGQTFWITNSHVCVLIVMLLMVSFALVVNIKMRHATEVPGTLQNIAELIVEMLDGMVDGTMGKRGRGFANYIATIFIFILVSNISGIFGLRPPTADFGVTLPLALVTWVMIQFNGFKYKKMGKIKALFEPMPLFFPINLISEFATPVSMSLRLFGNILSGSVMMALIYGLLPKVFTIAWPAALHAYLDVFSGGIQTFVFMMLTMVFVADAIGDEAAA